MWTWESFHCGRRMVASKTSTLGWIRYLNITKFKAMLGTVALYIQHKVQFRFWKRHFFFRFLVAMNHRTDRPIHLQYCIDRYWASEATRLNKGYNRNLRFSIRIAILSNLNMVNLQVETVTSFLRECWGSTTHIQGYCNQQPISIDTDLGELSMVQVIQVSQTWNRLTCLLVSQTWNRLTSLLG